MHGAAGGAPDPGDGDGDGRQDEQRERWDERPAKPNEKPAEKDTKDEEIYGQAIEDEIRFSRALERATGETTKLPAKLQSEYKHTKYQDSRF